MRPRRKPYTALGISRLTCAVVGCRRKSHAQWQVCADGNQYRGLCKRHDVQLNAMVMRWFFGSTREDDIDAYREKVLAA